MPERYRTNQMGLCRGKNVYENQDNDKEKQILI